ncbi:hypothetical protein [Actinophytocola sp.]|uniref:hypothetical protein n=1 Tax=Actinophytocola sp. TaxID=1872138 RepID=UPI002D7E53C0|nr:hypothetical protein [Actinophytocola sp.]HET9143725.1 hypothetical protein [Actinophytocola sp.]
MIALPAAIHTALAAPDAPALTADPTSDLLAWERSTRRRVLRLQATTGQLRQVLHAARADLHAGTGPGTRVPWPQVRYLLTQVHDTADELAAQTEALHDAHALQQAIRDVLRAVEAPEARPATAAAARRPDATRHNHTTRGAEQPGSGHRHPDDRDPHRDQPAVPGRPGHRPARGPDLAFRGCTERAVFVVAATGSRLAGSGSGQVDRWWLREAGCPGQGRAGAHGWDRDLAVVGRWWP